MGATNYSSKEKNQARQVEVHATSTAIFRSYNEVKITVPREAARLLSGS